ncbi:MAG: hypothetical protein AAF417_05370 [Pseudomonadota bacterium]
MFGLEAPSGGVGALRAWGQTAERSAGWIAAADPLFLEASLNHLLAHRLSRDELPLADLDEVYRELNAALGGNSDGNGGSEFFHMGRCGYLRSATELQTADVAPDAVYGEELSHRLPGASDGADYHRLHSEVQMVLHQASIQARRAASGLRPINALWIWGGGVAPPVSQGALPGLFAGDPLLRGYWYSRAGHVADWSGSLKECAERADGSFVAQVPETPGADDDPALTTALEDLKILLDSGRLDSVSMLFRDGVTAHARRRFRWRWWRSEAPWLRTRDGR